MNVMSKERQVNLFEPGKKPGTYEPSPEAQPKEPELPEEIQRLESALESFNEEVDALDDRGGRIPTIQIKQAAEGLKTALPEGYPGRTKLVRMIDQTRDSDAIADINQAAYDIIKAAKEDLAA